ncbi:SDR family NAD(P)-dependent oxidoreductase [Rhodobacterales bacterium HKCCE3408]|nr:SDR family NAD(P)-dependent oxidoreductase [Rhodobacterales bacterium HKCCE3408]
MKVMLVMGASSGIGRAVAELALSEGWQVGLFARRAEILDGIARGTENALALPGDVTDLAAVESAVAALVDRFGRLDVLFNNAGIFTPPGAIDEIAPEDWLRSVSVNLTGMFNAARAAFAQMRVQGGGRIINNGSISATTPREGSVSYTATKHGVTGLTKSLALDGRPLNIAVGQIDIGNARTPLVEALEARMEAEGKAPPASMDVADAARSVLYMAGLPLSANVLFHTIMATQMPFVGRG